MKLVIFYNKNKLSGKLTKFFTGCYAYHVGWLDVQSGKFYDMHFTRRRRLWSKYSKKKTFTIHDIPQVTQEYLESELDIDNSSYGILDYIMFAIRPILYFFKVSLRNQSGLICSEMCNNDIHACGGFTPFNPKNPPPSPCDLANWVQTLK